MMTNSPKQHTVIIGIGNELRGDDAAGVEVVRRLQEYDLPGVTLIDSGTVPENFLGPVVNTRPDRVLLIDAADMNEKPGTFHELDGNTLDWSTFSTHTNVLKLVMDYIGQETAADVRLIGIQPVSCGFGDTMSECVLESIDRLVDDLIRQLQIPATGLGTQ